MRRKPDALIEIEVAILHTLVLLERTSDDGVHGFALAKHLSEDGQTSRLASQGTLYRALDRLARAGFLVGSWEDPSEAADAGRPRRRTYRLTVSGQQALAAARTGALAGLRRAGVGT